MKKIKISNQLVLFSSIFSVCEVIKRYWSDPDRRIAILVIHYWLQQQLVVIAEITDFVVKILFFVFIFFFWKYWDNDPGAAFYFGKDELTPEHILIWLWPRPFSVIYMVRSTHARLNCFRKINVSSVCVCNCRGWRGGSGRIYEDNEEDELCTLVFVSTVFSVYILCFCWMLTTI